MKVNSSASRKLITSEALVSTDFCSSRLQRGGSCCHIAVHFASFKQISKRFFQW
jgi:hypothetical protein